MRLTTVLGLLLLLGLAACNANPLLQDAASNFLPHQAGSSWTYKDAVSGATTAVAVLASGPYQGRAADTIQTQVNAGPASLSYISFNGPDIDQWDPVLGWVLWQKLPLITGNQWAVPTSVVNRTQNASVDGQEDVTVPAGVFKHCFKISTTILDYAAGTTTTTGTIVWNAADIGRVQDASVDTAGATTIHLQLVSYHLP